MDVELTLSKLSDAARVTAFKAMKMGKYQLWSEGVNNSVLMTNGTRVIRINSDGTYADTLDIY